MFSRLYSGLFWVMVLAWPLALDGAWGQPYVGLALAANAATALFVTHRCSSEELGFVGGMAVIAGSSMSGCANVTLIYLPPLLAVVYLIALYQSVVSVFRGRAYSQGWWLGLVEGFYKRRLNAPLNPLTHLAPPDASSFETDPADVSRSGVALGDGGRVGEGDRPVRAGRRAAPGTAGRGVRRELHQSGSGEDRTDPGGGLRLIW